MAVYGIRKCAYNCVPEVFAAGCATLGGTFIRNLLQYPNLELKPLTAAKRRGGESTDSYK